MEIRYVSQPEITLGSLIEAFLSRDKLPEKVTFVSAFVSLTTILRLEEKLLKAADHGSVKLVVGVDLGGTSKEVLERLLGWRCESFVIHHSNPRHTFHPKIFLFEFEDESHLIVGSNNLTDGGLFSNFEAFSESTFDLPDDDGEYHSALTDLKAFLEPSSPAALKLTARLIKTLSDRGELPTEKEARKVRSQSKKSSSKKPVQSPFKDEPLPRAPELPEAARKALTEIAADLPEDEESPEPEEETRKGKKKKGAKPLKLVWESKALTERSLNIPQGTKTNITGDTNLGKGSFDDLDFKHYFRYDVFSDLTWRKDKSSRSPHLERATIRAELIIKGISQGVFDLEVTHDPRTKTKSYKQNNAMTKIKWGEARSLIAKRKLLGLKMRLHRRGPEHFVISIDK